MKYDVGQKVRIKSLDWYNENKDNYGAVYAGNGFAFWNYMAGLCGEIMTKGITMRGVTEEEGELFRCLIVLKRCRDAYWKIAGEEMGLGKPWEPDWDDDEWPDMYYISWSGKYLDKEKGYPCCNMILIFPTEEMRDAFYENFKELIEQCKELL